MDMTPKRVQARWDLLNLMRGEILEEFGAIGERSQIFALQGVVASCISQLMDQTNLPERVVSVHHNKGVAEMFQHLYSMLLAFVNGDREEFMHLLIGLDAEIFDAAGGYKLERLART